MTQEHVSGEALTADVLHRIVGLLTRGVTVVTARVDGRDHGVTASSVTSLSLEPPVMLVWRQPGRPDRGGDQYAAAGTPPTFSAMRRPTVTWRTISLRPALIRSRTWRSSVARATCR